MSDNREFDLDIDSILAEFSSYSETLSNPGQSGGRARRPRKGGNVRSRRNSSPAAPGETGSGPPPGV